MSETNTPGEIIDSTPTKGGSSSTPDDFLTTQSMAPTIEPAYVSPARPTTELISIIGLVLACLIPWAGLIISIIARIQAKKENEPLTLSTIGVIIGAFMSIIPLIALFIAVIIAMAIMLV